MSAVWNVNETKEITVITDQNVNLQAYYAASNSSTYVGLVGPFLQNGDRYYLSHSFDTIDQYTIRIVDLNGNIADLFTTVDVVPVSTLTAPQIADEILNRDIHGHLTENTVGAMLHNTAFIQSTVHVDTEALVNGHGTQQEPFNDFNDAKDFAEANNLYVLSIHGEVTIPSNFKGFTVTGIGLPVINCNGQVLSKSKFLNVELRGGYVGGIIVQDSVLSDGVTLDGFADNCALTGTVNLRDNGTALISNCKPFSPGNGGSTISMSALGTSKLSVEGWVGELTVTHCNTITDNLVVDITGKLTLDTTCTNGTADIRGVCLFVDNSTGTTVDATGIIVPHTIFSELTQIQADIAALPSPDEMIEAELHAGLDSYANKASWGQDVATEVAAVQTTVDSIETTVVGIDGKTYTANNWYTMLDAYTGKDAWKATVPDYTTRFDTIDTATTTITGHVDGLPAGQSSILSAVTGLSFDTNAIATDVWASPSRSLTTGFGSADRATLNALSNYDDSAITSTLSTLVARDPYSEASIHNALDTYTNKDDWKASTIDLTPVTDAIAALNNLSLLEIEGSAVLAKEATLGVISAAIGQIPTTDSVADLSPVLMAIANLNDVTPAEVRAAFDTVDFKDKNTENEIHTWLDSYTHKEDWKTDTSGLPDAIWSKIV